MRCEACAFSRDALPVSINDLHGFHLSFFPMNEVPPKSGRLTLSPANSEMVILIPTNL